jgi:hypothetical protein
MSSRNGGLRNLITFCLAVGLFYTLARAQDSVADAARKNRPKDTQTTTKRVWTNDDIASAGKKESTVPLTGIQQTASETLQKFRLLAKEELGGAVLKAHNAPNVDFPDRKDWEQKLFEAKRAWVDQVDRMVAHKDTNNYVLGPEIVLAEKAQENFERIVEEGTQWARAESDPRLKAHLQYERQLGVCNRSTGSFQDKCLARLAEFKFQMGQEGVW